jgi:hypothetical protein
MAKETSKCTFLDSEFSTLIENRNSFQFSQAIFAKTTSKLSCFKQREISIMDMAKETSNPEKDI